MYQCDSIDLCVTAYVTKQTVESRILLSDPIIKFWIQPSNSSVQSGFLKKISKKVRGVSKTHGYHNIACRVCGISALGVADAHNQL